MGQLMIETNFLYIKLDQESGCSRSANNYTTTEKNKSLHRKKHVQQFLVHLTPFFWSVQQRNIVTWFPCFPNPKLIPQSLRIPQYHRVFNLFARQNLHRKIMNLKKHKTKTKTAWNKNVLGGSCEYLNTTILSETSTSKIQMFLDPFLILQMKGSYLEDHPT